MKVALVFGSQGKSVKPRLQEVKDNLEIDCYDNVAMMIDTTYKRNLHYDRILVLSKQLTTVELMNDLYNFWSNVGKDTELVFLGKKGVDNKLANDFVDMFVTPVATAMLVENTTVALVAQSVLQSIQQLNKQFGVSGTLNVDTSDGVVLPALEKIAQEKKKKEELEKKKLEEERKKQEEKKSSGFLGSLFKKKSKSIQSQKSQVVQEKIPEQNMFNQQNSIETDTTYYEGYNENVEEVEQKGHSNNIEYENEVPNVQDNFSTEPNEKDLYYQDGNNIESNEEQDDDEVPAFMRDEQEELAYENEEEESVQNSLNSFENTSNTFEDVSVEEDDFAPEPEVEDEDFGSVTYTQEQTESEESVATVDDEDFSNMNLTQAEEEYKKANETPKVVTKTVVKEVIRNVATNTQLVDKIYNGINSQIIIVTGDRGTGVTTAALSLAKVFSEKVHVLYMDCDVDTHGLLSYINYESFRNYGETHMQGIKLCKNVRNFQNSCAISYDKNFDILSTDYTCDTTDEELEDAAGVVASIADEYGVVIVDCPASKLHCIGDLLIQGVTVVTVEASKRGFMNMLCTLENSPLHTKYKRGIAGKGTMFITKAHKNTDIKKLVNYVKAIIVTDDVDWLNMKKLTFDGKLTDIMINSILER